MERRASSNSTYSNVVKVTDEAWIAQRAAQKRPTWYLFKLGDRWPRCSLGTADLREARSLALKAYQAWLDDAECDWRAACGNVSHHVSFKTVAEEWLATQKTDHAYKAGVVRKFLLPFFDVERSATSMAMITQAMVDDYKVWQRDFWLTRQKAGNSTTVSDKQAENYREPSSVSSNTTSAPLGPWPITKVGSPGRIATPLTIVLARPSTT